MKQLQLWTDEEMGVTEQQERVSMNVPLITDADTIRAGTSALWKLAACTEGKDLKRVCITYGYTMLSMNECTPYYAEFAHAFCDHIFRIPIVRTGDHQLYLEAIEKIPRIPRGVLQIERYIYAKVRYVHFQAMRTWEGKIAYLGGEIYETEEQTFKPFSTYTQGSMQIDYNRLIKK